MKKAKLLSLFLAGTLLFHTAGIDALATTASDPVSVSESVEESEEISSEEISDQENPEHSSVEEGENEENPEQSATEDGKNKDSSEDEEKDKENEENSGNEEGSEDEENSGNEESSEDGENSENEENSDDQEAVEDEELSEDEENSEDTVSENTISENTLPEDEESIFDIFPGLGDNYTMSSEQLDSKRELAAHVGDIVKVDVKNAVNFPDAEGLYALGEVVYLAETEEEAEKVAKAFGGTLDSYSYEVAVISLPEQATVAMAIVAAADPDFKLPAVWPNYYYYLDSDINAAAASAPSDPGFANQWQHDYIGTRYAWAAGFKGQGIKVAVIDSGLKRDHDDLSANAEDGKTFVDGAEGKTFNGDNLEHGTHVAGIIAAAANNGKGGVGIAPEAKVRGYAVFNSAEETETAYIIRAINAAVQDENDIINMSIGGPMYDGNYADTVKEAYTKGVAIFASSGNYDSSANNFPAAYPSVISVGAVDQNSAKASFSNYGGTVKLSFPGVHIYSTIPSGYDYMSGTSQACPAAAGTAAVILSARADIKNKSGKARVDALLAAMKSSTTKCTTSGMGAGTTWLPGVLKIATDMTAPDAPTITIAETPSPADKSGKTYIAEEVTVSLSTKTAVGVELYYTTDGKAPSYKNGKIVVGTQYTAGTSFKVGGAKNKTIKAIAVNPLTGKVSKVASKACVLTPNPNGVEVKSVDGVTRIAPGKSLKFTATVTPSYAISTKVIWSVDAKAVEEGITVSNGTVKTVNSKTKITATGTYTVTATAVDKNNKPFDGKSNSCTFTVDGTLKSVNKIAFVDGTKAYKPSPLNKGEELELADYLSVTYQDKSAGSAADVVWTSNNVNIATVDNNGKVTAMGPGKAVIKAISNDGSNKSASCNITVNQPVTNISLSGPNKVAAGKGITLTAVVTPNNATNKKLDWKVAENEKVTVNASGKLTAKKDATGTCKVTAAAKDGSGIVSAAYTVTIISGEITNITLDQKTVTLFPPNTSAAVAKTKTKLNATVTGKDSAETSLITWTSSAPYIASVDQQGNVNAISAGKATITCASIDGSNKKATCTVTVAIPMSKLSIGPANGFGDYYTKSANSNFEGYGGYIAAGKSIKMSAKYTSNYGVPTNKKVIWKSSNPDLLKVDKNGKVTAKKITNFDELYVSAEITATADDGSGVVSDKYTFTITPLVKQLIIDDDCGVKGLVTDGENYGLVYPDYFTTTVSGGKNPGLSKGVKDNKFYTVRPVPGQVTTKKASNLGGYYKSDALKMTVTVKLRDGSNVSAKKSWYMVRFSDGKYGSLDL